MSNKFYKQIDSFVATMVSSYKDESHIIPMDSVALPNKDTIIEILHLLRELLFPGYFGKQNLLIATIEYHIGDLLINVHDKLHEQICSVLTHQGIENNVDLIDISEKADEIIYLFFGKLPQLRKVLATDVQAAFLGDPSADNKSEVIFSFPGIFAVSIYRLAHELYLLAVPLIPRIMTEYAHSVTGIDIHAGAKIGKYFFIDHGTGVVIGETTEIGDNVKIYQGVTLGALSTRGGQSLRGVKRHPTLEDEVTVYSGASILGGETVIGKGVVIGSNAFIIKSVPVGTRVSVKNQELVFKGNTAQEFKQEFNSDWII
ncbi:serine acetyltransferase [Paenibacillus psychroresistens]|uniref:Serine acetyltransferase n=1 Tax=Paenibacillus psychroresistens TaxID=1778678 RepID=A0A6B8RNT3_9BACL|nr:serine O-acetyltransferase EpsC [Paenibacillus psychroresistens]QGQ98011.1 serine acetyltransferase [Paenibacillus psychroresistens]